MFSSSTFFPKGPYTCISKDIESIRFQFQSGTYKQTSFETSVNYHLQQLSLATKMPQFCFYNEHTDKSSVLCVWMNTINYNWKPTDVTSFPTLSKT